MAEQAKYVKYYTFTNADGEKKTKIAYDKEQSENILNASKERGWKDFKLEKEELVPGQDFSKSIKQEEPTEVNQPPKNQKEITKSESEDDSSELKHPNVSGSVFKSSTADVQYYLHKKQNQWHRFDPTTGKDEIVGKTGTEAEKEARISQDDVDFDEWPDPIEPKDLYKELDAGYRSEERKYEEKIKKEADRKKKLEEKNKTISLEGAESRADDNKGLVTKDDFQISEEYIEELSNTKMPEITPELTKQFEGKVVPKLQEDWTQFGFSFEQAGKGPLPWVHEGFLAHGVQVTSIEQKDADGNVTRPAETMHFNLNDPESAKEMDAWMRTRATDQLKSYQAIHALSQPTDEQKNKIIPDKDRANKQIDKVRELWGLEGYSNDEVWKEMQKFSGRVAGHETAFSGGTGAEWTLRPEAINRMTEEDWAKYPPEVREHYERKHKLVSYTGAGGAKDDLNQYLPENVKDGNIFDAPKGKAWPKGAGTNPNEGIRSFKLDQWVQEASGEYTGEQINTLASTEHKYKELKALNIYKERHPEVSIDGLYDSDGHTEKGNKLLFENDEYQEILKNLKIDDKDLQKHIDKEFRDIEMAKYYEKNIENEIAKTNKYWLTKSKTQKRWKTEVEEVNEEVKKISQSIDLIANDYVPTRERRSEIVDILNQKNETYKEDLPELKKKYNIFNKEQTDKAVKNIEKEVHKELSTEKYKKQIEKIKKSHDLTTQEGIDAANEEVQALAEDLYANKLEKLNNQEQKKIDALNNDSYFKDYKELMNEYNHLKNNIMPVQEALLGKYTEDLTNVGVGEKDLEVMINALGKDYDFATTLLKDVGHSAVDLAQHIGLKFTDMASSMPKQMFNAFREDPEMRRILNLGELTIDPNKGKRKTKQQQYNEKNILKKASVWIDEKQAADKETYTRAVSFNEIKTIADGAEFAASTFMNFTPQLAMMIASGGNSGLFLMGAASAGGKWGEMNDALDLYERSGGEFGQNHSFMTMYANAIFTGVTEMASESVTLGQINKMKKVFGKNWKLGFNNHLKKNLFSVKTLKGFGSYLDDSFQEGFSEVVAQLSSNFADIASNVEGVHIYDGLPESFASGWIMSNGLKIPSLGKKLSAPFRSKDTNQRVGEISDKIQELSREASRTDLAPEKIEEIELEIKNLVTESGRLVANDLKRVDLIQSKNPNDIKALINIDKQDYNARKEAERIQLDGTLTEAQKKEKLAALQEKVNMRAATKDAILKKYKPEDAEKHHKGQIETAKAMANIAKEHGAPDVNIKEVNGEEFSEGRSQHNQNMSKKRVENIALENQGLIQGLQNIVNDKNSTKQEVAEAKEALKKAETQVQIADNLLSTDDYGVMQPKFDKKGNISSIDIMINKDAAIEDGMISTAAHEFIHATFANTLKSDPAMRNILGGQIKTILEGSGVEFSSDAKFREFNKRIAGYDVDQQGEEMMAIASEMMLDGDIKFKDGPLTKLGNVFRRFTQNTIGYDIKFNNKKDIENFMKDYHYSIKNNKPSPAIAKMLAKGANGKMFKDARTPTERKNQEMHSRAVEKNIESNPDLKDEFDNLVKKEDGKLKHKNNEDFKLSPEYTDGYSKIVDSKLLDGLIRQGMTERGLPPGALKDFTRKVKEQIGDRYLTNYNLDKNDSLFGWLTGVSGGAGQSIIYRAKGDVMKQYAKEGKAQEVSIDKPIGETGTIADVIKAEKDNLIDQIENADMSPAARNELSNDIKGLKMVMEALGFPKDIQNSITNTINKASIPLEDLTYKNIRDLLLSTEGKITTEKKAIPTGPLFEVLNAVSTEFGVDPLRILAKQDLNAEQRKAAQSYIFDKAVNEDGSLNTNIIDILPEGADRSGKSTGVANTKLGQFYTKGKRAKMKAGATAAGLATQTKRTDITKDELLDLFGINPDGSTQPGTKADGAIRELIVQVSQLAANQGIRLDAIENKLAASEVIAKLSDGTSEAMFNKKIKTDPKFDVFKLSQKLESKYEKKNLMPGGWIEATLGAQTKNGVIVKEGYADIKMLDLNAPYIVDGKDTGITIGEHLKQGVGKMAKKDPRLWKVFHETMVGSVSRQSMMVKDNFIEIFGPDPTLDKNGKYNEAKYGPPIYNKRIKYTKKINGVPVQNKKVIENLKESDFKNFVPNLIKTFKIIESHLKTDKNPNPKDTDIIALLISDTVNNQTGAFSRTSAPIGFILINPVTGQIDVITRVTEEHTAPQKYLVTNVLFNAARGGYVDAVAPVIKAIYIQGPFAHADDTIVNVNYARSFPKDFYDNMLPLIKEGNYPKELLSLVPFIRCVVPHKMKYKDKNGNDVFKYVNMNKYVIPFGIYKGKTVPEAFGVGMKGKVPAHIVKVQNGLMQQVLNGKISIKTARETFQRQFPQSIESHYKDMDGNKVEIDNGVKFKTLSQKSNESLSRKKSPKVKGMSTFDFDDTLARTKSGVQYTVPNPSGEAAPQKKVIFLAGGPGSGKSSVVKQLDLQEQGFKIVNQDISLEWLAKNHGLPANMNDFTPEQASKWAKLQWEARDIAQRKKMKFQGKGDGVVVDGTGAGFASLTAQMNEFKTKGYDVQMVFVETDLKTAIARNKTRKERSLKNWVVVKTHKSVMANKDKYKKEFGDNFVEVNTNNLKQGDPMPTDIVAKVDTFTKGYIKGRLTAEQFANQGAELQDQGAQFDFSEFNKIVEGKPGPYLQTAINRAKKYGTKDMFVLTARTQDSARAIHEFLKSQGLNIPIENITGLADSTGQAKADWMLNKFAEGYNDMYFVDDAFANVDAVQNVLNQLDIKSKVVQAKLNNSNKLVENGNESMSSKIIEPDTKNPDTKDPIDKEFNDMIERKKGIDSDTIVSRAEARKRGSETNITRFLKSLYIPPSAEDFKGLLYYFVGKGKQGDADLKWFKEKLFDPFAKGIRSWNAYKQNMVDEYKALKKKFPSVSKILNKKAPGTIWTNDTAVRVYLWNKAGFNIPGIDDATIKKLVNHVNNNPDIKAFADGLSIVTRRAEGYVNPSENWMMESIPSDMNNLVNKVGRKEFLQEWVNMKNVVFSKDNLNKIRATYGDGFTDALENILYRMENGGNRIISQDKVVNRFTNWINNSVGAIMFFNMRSALLQTISTVNFINWGDNNIFKASAAFANVPQFWSDFAMLFNSPQLKQRRKGLQTDVSASELQKTFSEKGFSPGSVINYLLQVGFTPTQIADSFAIAFGGASFYRNRFKKYIKEGMSPKKANEQAMLDFQEIAEETQQSSREDLVSQEQASVLGRIVLAFQNVTMQMGRLTKKSLSDLVNGRGDFKTNVSKILYYGIAQNIVFASLQSALAMIMWGDDEEEIENRTVRAANQALDSFLRGMGLYGALLSTLKNTIRQWHVQKAAPYGKRDKMKIAQEMINLSPPIGSKIRKIMNAFNTELYNKGVSEKIGFRIENPELRKWASIIEAVTNIPLARVVNKANNLEEAMTGDHLIWQKVAMTLGWNKWDVGVKDEELEAAKAEVKEERKEEKKKEKEEKKIKEKKVKEEEKKKEEERKKKEGIKTIRCSGVNSSGQRCGLTTETKAKTWKCFHHSASRDGSDRDGDGIKEYQCTAATSSGRRCKNKTENTNKKCYAHQ